MKKREKGYIDTDVYQESKNRIKRIIDGFDTIAVCFSGGKDSLVVLNLVQEVYDELGIKQKIKVIFRDEELIPDDVVNFVCDIRNSGKYDFYYYAIPLKSNKYILGKTYEYVQWDSEREWVRNPPEFAIRLAEGDKRVFDQYSADDFIAASFKGKVAFINGIRCQESIVRLHSVLNKVNECYISDTQSKRVKLCKPIYDWTEDDVFLYFYKRGIKYCQIYDNQLWNDECFRVSTPLHSESAKKFHKLKSLYPDFYQKLLDIFPEMKVQSRYNDDVERKSNYDGYEHSIDGLYRYIKDSTEDIDIRNKFIKNVQVAYNTRRNKIKQGATNLGGYPLKYLFDLVARGSYKRRFMPKPKPTKEDIEFEN